jgi:glycogen(starch) synthase
VHAHDWLVAHAAATLKHHLRAPLVATVHATEAGRHQGWLPGPMNKAIHSVEWWLTYEARRVVSCSEYMRWEVTRLFDLPPDKMDVVPNGIRVDGWRPDPARGAAIRARYGGTGPLLLFAGRLVYEKGVHDLLRAMPRLRRRHPGIRLVIAGAGPHDESLKEQARQLRLGRSVVFAGFVGDEELAALAAAAECVVVPSLYEPFGLVALEAAAAGTPVAVSDVGGLAELVVDGRTGVRFAPGDPAALAAAVDRLLADQVLSRRLVRNARTVLAAKHTWAAVAEQTVATYALAARQERALLASGRAAPRLVVRDGNLLTGRPG